jgi:hypothetical protein
LRKQNLKKTSILCILHAIINIGKHRFASQPLSLS